MTVIYLYVNDSSVSWETGTPALQYTTEKVESMQSKLLSPATVTSFLNIFLKTFLLNINFRFLYVSTFKSLFKKPHYGSFMDVP